MLRIHLCPLGCLASHGMSPLVPLPLEERMTVREERIGEEGRNSAKLPLLFFQAVAHREGQLQ